MHSLASAMCAERPASAVVVLAHGCFDLLHLGHIEHLQAAKAMGDRLVVSVTKDEHVNKGFGRPHFTAEQRAKALRALDCVDEVVISESGTAVDTILRLRPAIYVKGIDYADGGEHPGLAEELAAVKAHGGRFTTTATQKWSSSRLLNAEKYLDTTLTYLAGARERGFRDKILAAFDRADRLNIVCVGEVIEDEYIYVAPLGKPAKESILATVETGREMFKGGVIAAVKHAEWKNIHAVSIPKPIRKTRYVEDGLTRKLFELYSARAVAPREHERSAFHTELSRIAEEADAVVVLDFGHGLMDQHARDTVQHAKFLAVNTQTNAGNYGFNLITKYMSADLICIDEPEARLATANADGSVNDVMRDIGLDMGDVDVIVTRGRHGCVAQEARLKVPTHLPPFATNGLDTMGAGDAFLAVTAPLVAAGLELEAAAFVGNVAGAIKVSIVGHRRHVGRQEIIQTVEALLA